MRFAGIISRDGVPTMRKTGSNSSSGLIPYSVAISALIVVPLAAGEAAAESKTDTIGPWQIEATFTG